MTATQSIDLPGWMAEQLSQASPDLLRAMLQTFAEALMSADADAVCGAGYGQRNPDRTNTPQRLPAPRLGHPRRVDRSGDPEAAGGSYFPDWLLGGADGPSPPLCRWWRPATYLASRHGGWRSWSKPSASPG